MARLIPLFLVALALAVYSPLLEAEFINFDDPGYVYSNPQVMAGPSWEGLRWAFSTTSMSNWHPLTWVSHQVDAWAWGAQAGGHHLTSVVIHAATGLILFGALEGMLGAAGALLVAGIFLVHPLHVESVAWVSERKDVLSGLFFALCLLFHVKGRRGPRAAALALGLLAKPMLVSVPLVLLLVDWWPLRRGFRVLEKAELFVMAGASCLVTYAVQKSEGAMTFGQTVGIGERLATAGLSVVSYLAKTVFPVGLSAFYPHHPPSLIGAVGAWWAILTICFVALVSRKAAPALFVGWFWFLGMLIPVIGLVQVGSQAMADRYTYLPMIGLTMAGAAALRGRKWAIPAVLALLLALSVRARDQVWLWQSTTRLFSHALRLDPTNWVAHNSLGIVKANSDPQAALAHFAEAVRQQPVYPDGLQNMGVILMRLGRNEEAVREFSRALDLFPAYSMALVNRAGVYLQMGRTEEALRDLKSLSPEARSSPQVKEVIRQLSLQVLYSP